MHRFDPDRFLYDGAHVQGGDDLAGRTLPTVEVADSVFERVVFSGATLRRWVFENSRLVGCDFSNVNWGDSALEGVRFEGCKLVGVDFQTARQMAFDADFRACTLRMARISAFDLRGTTFVDCDLRDVDFTGADCRGIRFERCDLRGALFERTDLRDADLSTARGVVLDPATNRIRGTRIDAALAIELVRRQGFVVD
jgi:uncharacterized protein YjbI with pentapeptide repeats